MRSFHGNDTQDEERRVAAMVVSILSDALRAKGWQQKDLHRSTGLSTATVSRVLTGDLPMSVGTAEKIARALDLDMDVLVALAFVHKDIGRLKKEYRRHPLLLYRLETLEMDILSAIR